jgi:CDP-diacylglycerol pyrophosphatase
MSDPLPNPPPRGASPPLPRGRGGLGSACIFLALACVIPLRFASADENALWYIVSEQCVPDQQQFHSPKPCEQVDLAGGYVVLKDIVGNTQFLLMPTARITGIESSEILAPNAPNYWDDAWRARHFVEERALHHLPRDAIGLAINSVSSRSQNQLHIHVDCMRIDVTTALREHAGAVGKSWSKFPVPLSGHDYMAMRIEQPELGSINPFDLLANGVPGARTDMGHYTLVVVGDTVQGKDGFVVLAGHASPATGNWGSGEQLQDHACAAATAASR